MHITNLHNSYKLLPQGRRPEASKRQQNVQISSPHRTADPAVETLCAGAHPQSPARLARNNSDNPALSLGLNIGRYIRDSTAVDIERVSATLPATTDPTGTRKMFELERALAQLPLEQRQVAAVLSLLMG